MHPLPHTRSCFVCGESNAAGLKLVFHTDGSVVAAEYVAKAEHCGFKGVLHGGITATLLDEIMVWAAAVGSGKFGFCAELNIRYLRPVASGQTVSLEARLVENKRGRIFITEGTLMDPETKAPFATGTAKYMPIPGEKLTEMAEDFVGDPARIRTFLRDPSAGIGGLLGP